mgnify:CR=1 FL=1
MADSGTPGGETLLFLTDEQLRRGIEAMFFAYRAFTADPDRLLEEHGYGRAHHRAAHDDHVIAVPFGTLPAACLAQDVLRLLSGPE